MVYPLGYFSRGYPQPTAYKVSKEIIMNELVRLLTAQRLNRMERKVAMLDKALEDIEDHLLSHPLLVNQRPFLDMFKELAAAEEYIADDFHGPVGIENNPYVKAYVKGLDL